MTCPICNSRKTFLKYKNNLKQSINDFQVANNYFGLHGNVYKCRECNLGWINDNDLTGQLLSGYQRSTFDDMYEKEYKGRKKTAKALIKKLQKIQPNGKILDIGCYTGVFLQSAQEMGYLPFGVEASPIAIKIATLRVAGNLRQGMAEDILPQYPNNFFDIITLIDVIEHLNNPRQILQLCYSKLKKGGVIVVSTPDFSSYVSRIQGENWHAILPHHLFYFSFGNLHKMLGQENFTINKKSHFGRYFTLGYLAWCLRGFNELISRAVILIVKIFKLERIIIPVNLFDQLIIFAQKR